MTTSEHNVARRTLLKGASASVGAGVLAGVAPVAAEPAPVWNAEYWAKKGDVKLNLWRKRAGAPAAGKPARPVVFLVHGSSNSARVLL